MTDVIALPTKEDLARAEEINHELAVKVINLLDENEQLRTEINLARGMIDSYREAWMRNSATVSDMTKNSNPSGDRK